MSSRPRVALLEARMSRELARLVEKHGGAPVCVPAVQETGQELDPDMATRLITALAEGDYDIAVFMTGVAVSLLFEIGRAPPAATGPRRGAAASHDRLPRPEAHRRAAGLRGGPDADGARGVHLRGGD